MTPQTVEELRAAIVDRHEQLSKRLQQIGRYVLDHPNEVALETLAVIASRCAVQPSAIVRFAKTFGFEGASQMQKLLRDSLLTTNSALGYAERVRRLDEATRSSKSAPADLLAEFVEGSTLALEHMLETVPSTDVDAAVRAIVDAQTVYIVGFRRSFPVAAYLAYSLLQAGKRAVLIDGVGGLGVRQAQAMGEGDLLIAISFQPYAEETLAVVDAADGRGPLLAITDTLVSPIAKTATIALQVRESEVRGFRSLTASMCLAQALAINFAVADATEPAAKPKRRVVKRRLQ
ncbi:MurR/RpiR family transcriptional regulator [Sphingomonas sp.]|uniref:MurR/RpiR family transcriptional regulator n=1 Tax=Sphingomonas sp. TaxID=28214 RepID=UPI000DB848F1|nr:MurR/RpiR family transcriptional regulator [Sphingomonas sp.]PZU06738.1 MAG: iron dicitrate transport regulator FecR [Sphingomonas sp.]